MEEQNDTVERLAAQVMTLAQSRLTADLRFLSASLEQLRFCPRKQPVVFATDGKTLYYSPEMLLAAFKVQQHQPTRMLLHVTLHCILGHPFQKQEKKNALWDIACDIAAEEVIRQLEIPACTLSEDSTQDDWRRRLVEACPHMTAEELYNYLLGHNPEDETRLQLQQLFCRDSHLLWYAHSGAHRKKAADGMCAKPKQEISPREESVETSASQSEEDETRDALEKRRHETIRREWKQLARQAKADLQNFSRRFGHRAGALMDGLETVTFEEVDYSEFLRRFGEQNEVIALSDEAFDLIYYTYGLKTYGNVPLIEPLEFHDEKRIREFVIAIDTSGSVQGEIVQSFLQHTCNVLRQIGSFTSQVELYLIQCDATVQSVQHLTSLEQLDALLPKLTLRGFGGTDFRPVFDYIDHLLEQRVLTNLNGLLYFTDGVGAYPARAPAYKTAFIFHRDDAISPHVPSWAIRAVLTTDNIRLLQREQAEEET
jgi:predicted metal-dependent peptidase